MEIAGSRILVTGGTGLIGSHAIDQVAAEGPQEILVLTRHGPDGRPPPWPPTVRAVHGDLARARDLREVLRGVDYVLHIASLLTRESAADPSAGFAVNVAATFALLQASSDCGVKKVIYSSSNAVYGRALTTPVPEEHPLNSLSTYGAGKIACEAFLRAFRHTRGLEYVALRYASVYGPRQHARGSVSNYIPECLARVEQGLSPVIYGDGRQRFEFAYVEDVARAIVQALKSGASGEAINVGPGTLTALREIAHLAIKLSGAPREPIYLPEEDRFAVGSFPLDVRKAEGLLGLRVWTSIEDGLQRMWKWRRAHVAQTPREAH